MSDCLVTKLRAAVTDSNLPKLGVGVGDIKAVTTFSNEYRAMHIVPVAGDVRLKITGNAHFTNNTGTSDLGKEAIVANGQDKYLWISIQDGLLEIYNVYSLSATLKSYQNNIEFYLDGFSYSNLVGITERGWIGTIKELPKNIQKITAVIYLQGNLADLAEFTSLQEFVSAGMPNITPGVITDLGPLTSLKKLQITSYQDLIPLYPGDLVDFVVAQRANGRTSVLSSDPITFSYLNINHVTFNGNSIGSGTKTLYWDASTITFDGTTITA